MSVPRTTCSWAVWEDNGVADVLHGVFHDEARAVRQGLSVRERSSAQRSQVIVQKIVETVTLVELPEAQQ